MKTLQIYTDGSCLRNPGGQGGWAFVVLDDNQVIFKSSGSEYSTTNNRMEMMAGVQALKYIEQMDVTDCIVTIYSDSQLVVNTMTFNWKKLANQDLWYNLIKSTNSLSERGVVVEWEWVKGHAGDKYNEIVDRMAFSAANYQKQAEFYAEIDTQDCYSFVYQSKKDKVKMQRGQLSFV